MKTVLSLFPGVGLLDRGFEDAGFCVLRGPDKIWGGDIRKFFPSAYAGYVYRTLVDEFECSHDVAAIVMRLTTAFGHLPTGGNSSTIISFFAFKPMFDTIYLLATSRGLAMSCCVDDMTFSGAAAGEGFLNEVRLVIRRFGLKAHKRHCFEAHQPKIVTGVALTPQGMRLPNARRRKLHDSVVAFDAETNPAKKVKIGERLLGRTTEAAQVERGFSALIPVAAAKLTEAKRVLKQAH